MKKLLTIAAVVMAAMFAKADTYLYWTVDVGEFTDAKYAEIGGYDGGVYTSVGDMIGRTSTNFAGDTSLGSTIYTDYLVKLFDSSLNEIAQLTTAVNYSSTLSQFAYTAGPMAERPASPYSFSGFTASIPEPTSGLLMLLGLAGLALKRSRLR